MNFYFAFQIDIVDLIKSCESESALEFLEQSFVLTEEQKRVVFQQKIMFWTNAMAEDIQQEIETPVGVVPGLMANWTEEEKRQFNKDWANDEFLCHAVEQPEFPEALESHEDIQQKIETPVGVVPGLMANWTDEEKRQFNEDWANDEFLCHAEEQPEIPEALESQVGGGNNRRRSNNTEFSPERLKPEDYFTIKSVKPVKVRKFRTTGTDYTVQFKPLNVHGVSDVMSVLNRAFQHLFDRLTVDMSLHDQVRLILSSHQLDRPISLPFLPRDRLTPERFLAAVERVVQSNTQFTLDESVNVNVVHVEMPHGGARKRRDVINLQSYLNKKGCIVQIKNKDELCCARAIVVAKAKIDKDPQYKCIANNQKPLQGRLAYELHELHEARQVEVLSRLQPFF